MVLRVRHVETEIPVEIAWTRSVTARMRRLDAGDVVFGGKAHTVRRAYVDRTEVTNAQYRAFLDAARASGGHGDWCHADEPKGWDHRPPAATWEDARWSADALPVVNVSWWDAWAYARWTGRRLPTEAEWVRAAAKAADEEDLRSWPPFPGSTWKDGVLATSETTRGAGPVAADAGDDVSPAGCLHMGGNVSEWVAVAGGGAGVRGGNWFLTHAAAEVPGVPARTCARSFRARTIGFRCAADPEGARR
jgi:formylglycine-generating enzyme required for sulfatase activity